MTGFSSGLTAGMRPLHEAMPGFVRSLMTGTFARYFSSSVVALGADAGSFLILLQLGVAPAPAAASGFMVGVAVQWLVTSRIMFADCVATRGPARRRQQAMFAASALFGLVLTTTIVGGAAALAFNPRLAKLVAVAVSFVTTSAWRHLLVFGKARLG